jgi:hypothetical protein
MTVEISLILFLEVTYIISTAIDKMEPVLLGWAYKWSIFGTNH